MNSSTKRTHHFGYWVLGIIVLMAFGLADMAAVALPAMVISVTELFAVVLAFVLISGGALFTVWQLGRVGK